MFKAILLDNNKVGILNTFDNTVEILSQNELKESNFIVTYNNNLIQLYHGSPYGIKGKIIPKSKEGCDFGFGFYTATMKDYALSNLITEKKDGKGYYYSYILDLEGLSVFDFENNLRLWFLYTAYNRKIIDDIGHYKKLADMIKSLEQYDVIKGLIADDRSAYAFGRFLTNAMTDECLLECLKYFNLGFQYDISLEIH